MEREREKLKALLDKTVAKLEDPGFRSRAPPAVVEESEKKVEELRQRIARIDTHMSGVPPKERAP